MWAIWGSFENHDGVALVALPTPLLSSVATATFPAEELILANTNYKIIFEVRYEHIYQTITNI